MAEAEKILQQLNEFAIDSTPSTKQLDDTNAYYTQVQKFNDPVKIQNEKLDALRNEIGMFSDKMEDLFEWSLASNKLSDQAQYIHNKNKNASVNAMFDTVNNHTKETIDNIDETHIRGIKCEVTLGEIDNHLTKLDHVNTELKEINQQVDIVLPQQDLEYTNLDDILKKATDNRDNLVAAVRKNFNQFL